MRFAPAAFSSLRPPLEHARPISCLRPCHEILAALAGRRTARRGRATRSRATDAAWRPSGFAAAALETLLNAIDANDPETGAHVRRVARYALILGRRGRPRRARARERRARRALPRHRQDRRGALRHHPRRPRAQPRGTRADRDAPGARRRGARAAGRASIPSWPTACSSHHERWDGNGYPRGLRGERIPLAARIVASRTPSTRSRTTAAISSARQPNDVARRSCMEGRAARSSIPTSSTSSLSPPVFDDGADGAEREIVRLEPRRRRASAAGGDDENVPDLTFRWRPATTHSRAARSGSGAAKIALITATPLAPAASTCGHRSARRCRRSRPRAARHRVASRANSAAPMAAPASALKPVAKIGPMPT